MAIKIYEKFAPFANPATGDYPHGSIKNDSIPGAEDGTPLDADLGNDYVGFDAALLAEAGIAPSGLPDTAINSQRVEAVKSIVDLRSISRSLNVLDSQVIYATNTATQLGPILYIHDAATQKTWAKPTSVGAAEVIVSVNAQGVLTTNVGTHYLRTVDSQASTMTLDKAITYSGLVLGDSVVLSDRGYGVFDVVLTSTVVVNGWDYINITVSPHLSLSLRKTSIFNVTQFGADKTGLTNTTGAFFAANAAITANGGGRYEADAGVYTVSEEEEGYLEGKPYYRSTGAVISLDGIDGLDIALTGCLFKIDSGLHYGSFDPVTGVVFNAPPGGFFNTLYQASPLTLIQINACKNVTITNPDLHGNVNGHVLGGYWGDVNYQLAGDGLRITNCESVTVINPKTNYFGRDGIYITGPVGLDMNITITNPISNYNGRQGLSWTGGDGLTLINPTFTYTGRNGSVNTAPGAGMDIEDNGQGCGNGVIIGGVMAGNAGPDFLCIATVSNVQINGTVFAGDGRTVWVLPSSGNKSVTFNGCEVYGNVVNPGTDGVWNDCKFYDVAYKDYPTPNGLMFETAGASERTELNNCKVYQTTTGRYFRIDNRRCKVRNMRYEFNIDSVQPRQNLGVFAPYSIDGMFIIDNLTNEVGDLSIEGEHAYVDIGGAFFEQISGLQFLSTKIGVSRFGVLPSVQGRKRSGAVTDFRTYIGNDSATITIPLGYGPKFVTIVKPSGNSILRGTRCCIMVLGATGASDVSAHDAQFLTKIEQGLGTGGLNIVLADATLSGRGDSLVITSSGQSLLGERWDVYEHGLTLFDTPVVQTTEFSTYTLPAAGFPI